MVTTGNKRELEAGARMNVTQVASIISFGPAPIPSSCTLPIMSLLHVVQRGAAGHSMRFAAANILRRESTSATEKGVEVAQQQPSEITTIPTKEAVPADLISGAPGAIL